MLENAHFDEGLSVGSFHDCSGVLLERHGSIFSNNGAYILKNHDFNVDLLGNLAQVL